MHEVPPLSAPTSRERSAGKLQIVQSSRRCILTPDALAPSMTLCHSCSAPVLGVNWHGRAFRHGRRVAASSGPTLPNSLGAHLLKCGCDVRSSHDLPGHRDLKTMQTYTDVMARGC